MPIFSGEYPQKATPQDDDEVLIADSAASSAIKKTKLGAILNRILSLTRWIKADKDIDWETFQTAPVNQAGIQYTFTTSLQTIYENTSDYSELVSLIALSGEASTAPGTQVNVRMGGSSSTDRIGYINQRGGGATAIVPPGGSIVASASSGTLTIYLGVSVSPIMS